MKKMILAAIVTLAAIPAASAQDYVSLTKGNKWTFTDGFRTWTAQVEESNGKEAVVVLYMGEELFSRTWYRIDADGIKEEGYENQKGRVRYDAPILALKFPLQKGNSWSQSYSLGGQRYESTTKVEDEVGLTVPAGTFQVLKVTNTTRFYGGVLTTTDWYGKEVGLVRRNSIWTMNGISSETNLQLTQAELKPATRRIERREAPTPTCHKCGSKMEGNQEFCGECGEKRKNGAAAECKKCKAKLEGDARFCGECGTSRE